MTIGTKPIEVSPDPFPPFMIGQGHVVGKLVFLSGQASIDGNGAIVGAGDVEVRFVSGSGQLAYHVSSRDLALEIPEGAPSSKIALDLHDQHLGGGECHVGVELIDGAQRSVAKQDRATVFFVESAPFGRGTAHFDVTGSVS